MAYLEHTDVSAVRCIIHVIERKREKKGHGAIGIIESFPKPDEINKILNKARVRGIPPQLIKDVYTAFATKLHDPTAQIHASETIESVIGFAISRIKANKNVAHYTKGPLGKIDAYFLPEKPTNKPHNRPPLDVVTIMKLITNLIRHGGVTRIDPDTMVLFRRIAFGIPTDEAEKEVRRKIIHEKETMRVFREILNRSIVSNNQSRESSAVVRPTKIKRPRGGFQKRTGVKNHQPPKSWRRRK